MKLKYLNHYPQAIKTQVTELIKQDKLGEHLLSKYKKSHSFKNDKALYAYTNDLKNTYMKKVAHSQKLYMMEK